jgi:hypothetical protein
MSAYTILSVLVVLAVVVIEGIPRRGVMSNEKPNTIRPSEREDDKWYKG